MNVKEEAKRVLEEWKNGSYHYELNDVEEALDYINYLEDEGEIYESDKDRMIKALLIFKAVNNKEWNEERDLPIIWEISKLL